jgi:fucose permease
MIVIAEMGVLALWLMYLWLAAAIAASYLSNRKGYGEKIGLAFGLVFTVIGTLIWLFWPAKPDSKWKILGPFGRGKEEDRTAQRTA